MALRRNMSSLYSKIPRPVPEIGRRTIASEQQQRPIFQAAAAATGGGGVPASMQLRMPVGNQLMEAIRGGMDNYSHERVHLNVLLPKPVAMAPPLTPKEEHLACERRILDAKNLLRASKMEAIRAALRRVPTTTILYSEFLAICRHEPATARALDESGSVIVLGNIVFPRPDEVVRAIEKVVMPPEQQPAAEETAELEDMAEKKAAIDRAAEAGVRRELWGGMAVMAAQTAAFMRLTFWELSWDVMEPICFFVTSAYFIAGYAFFLRTSREPTFEGFFASRFAARQRRLMAQRGFDLRRFNELLLLRGGGEKLSTGYFSSSMSVAPLSIPRHHQSNYHLCDGCHKPSTAMTTMTSGGAAH